MILVGTVGAGTKCASVGHRSEIVLTRTDSGDLCATVGAVPFCHDAEDVKWKTIANGD